MILNGPSAVNVVASNVSNLTLGSFYANPLAGDTITITSPAQPRESLLPSGSN